MIITGFFHAFGDFATRNIEARNRGKITYVVNDWTKEIKLSKWVAKLGFTYKARNQQRLPEGEASQDAASRQIHN